MMIVRYNFALKRLNKRNQNNFNVVPTSWRMKGNQLIKEEKIKKK